MGKETITLPDMSHYKIKNDRFKHERGNVSTILDISCAKCDTELFIYQKDGPGSLIRCYLDRIIWKPDVSDEEKQSDTNTKTALHCPQCHTVIATPMIYEPEKRPAFRMIPGTFKKEKYHSPQK